jgi:hypothetical protein
MIEAAVRDLKSIIAEHDGENVADLRFARRVDLASWQDRGVRGRMFEILALPFESNL